MREDRYEVAIVGAGIAGAAVAFHLAQRGVGRVLLLEREAQPGGHSTARNAAILRSAIPDPLLHRLASRSSSFYRAPPAGFAEHPLVDPVGLVLAAPPEHAAALHGWVRDPRHAQGGCEIDPDELRRVHPYGCEGIAAAYRFDDEGVLDVDAILQAFLRGARDGGVELRTACSVHGLRIDGDGRLRGLDTDTGTVDAERVVLAGGGWAARPAERAGLGLPVVPHRRHLLVTAADAAIDPRAPVVWLQGEEFYFRPESGGMLMSACDHLPVAPEDGELSDEAELQRIAAKAARWLPGLGEAGAAHWWAGMRTFVTGDQRFLVGPDPRLQGLHWAAALGGHGISCAHAVGELLAELVDDGGRDLGDEDRALAEALSPARLLTADAADSPASGAASARASGTPPLS